jgi:hypothetical protein
MAEQRLLGIYADARAAVQAVERLRGRGLVRLESFSPLPDPVLEYAVGGGRPSEVRAFTLAGGVIGCASGLALAIRASLAWPLMTGGKPIVSLPAFLLIGYETTILFGALATLLGFLVLARLPRRPAPHYDPRFTADHFGVLVTTATPEEAQAARELLVAGAVEVRLA